VESEHNTTLSPNRNNDTLMSTTIIQESSPYSQRSLSSQLSQISNTSNRHSINLNITGNNLLTQADIQFNTNNNMDESINIQPIDLQSTYPNDRDPSQNDDTIFNDNPLTQHQGQNT
jgi:hypothetical protein